MYSVNWDAEFTVFSDPWSTVPPDAGVAYITGVGTNIYGPWQVPMDEHMSWDDDSYVPQEEDRVALMRQEPVKGRHGFAVHDACWSLLRAALDPQPVPLVRLFRLCKSLPSPAMEELCWSHDYYGLGRISNYIVDMDPYDTPDISQLLALPRGETESQVLRSSWESRDCFMRIPLEIRQAIAAVTPTRDALNLGLASRSFTNIVTSRMFWASRFAPGGERDFIIETRSKPVNDWKQLYQNTCDYMSLALSHRMRIWKSILYINELLELRPESAESRIARTLQLHDNENSNWRWRQVMCDVKERGEKYIQFFSEGCRAFGQARAVVSPSLSRIAFSVIPGLGNYTDYVAGFCLINTEDVDQQVGFRAVAKERSFAVTADALRGFKISMNGRGICALQVVCRDGTQSPWFGKPDFAITERLVCETRIVALDTIFDVSLTRPRPLSPSLTFVLTNAGLQAGWAHGC